MSEGRDGSPEDILDVGDDFCDEDDLPEDDSDGLEGGEGSSAWPVQDERGHTPEEFDRDSESGERESTSTLALFEGDEGKLTVQQRRALLALLKHRFISARLHQKEWEAIAANPRLFRSRLNDVFLDLVIDTNSEVAHKRQVQPEGGGRYPTLLHDVPWGREETVLLVFLRTRYRNERAAGAERVFVDRVDMHDYIAHHRPASATDVAGDRKRAARAIEGIAKAGLLVGRSDGDRFEISNAVEVLLPLPKLRTLLDWLRQQTHDASSDQARLDDGYDRSDAGLDTTVMTEQTETGPEEVL